MATLYYAPTSNFKQTTLNGGIDDSVTTITLASTTNLSSPGYIVVDRVNSSGVATPSAREVIRYTGISGNDITGCTRGADNSSAQSHSDGAIVETTPTVGMWNSLTTVVGTAVTGDGYLKAINSPVSLSYIQAKTLSVNSIASVAQLQVADLRTSNISVAVHGGQRGHFLWTVSGSLTTSLATSTNSSQIPFLRATKNLSLVTVYMGLNSAPSLAPLQIDIYRKSLPTGVTGTSIFSVRPLVGIGLNEGNATTGTFSLTSLASGSLLYPEIRQPGGAGDFTLQLVATERA